MIESQLPLIIKYKQELSIFCRILLEEETVAYCLMCFHKYCFWKIALRLTVMSPLENSSSSDDPEEQVAMVNLRPSETIAESPF